MGFPHENFFAHKWYIACDDPIDETLIRDKIDKHLCDLNDDYAVERTSALKEVFLQKLPEELFLKFMAQKGKLGSQHKFPRVLKGKMLQDWNEFLKNIRVASVTSLKETPIIKANPPFTPLLMLCLIIEKTTGPTAMLNNKPSVIPFHNASIIIPR